MRAALSILGLVVVLTIVLLMSKKQMQQVLPRAQPAAASAPAAPDPAALGRQVQDSLEQAQRRASDAAP